MVTRLLVLFITLQSSHHITDAAKTNNASFTDPALIMYPGPVKGLENKYGTEETTPAFIPKECEGKTFCTIQPPDYPAEEFNRMFKGQKQLPQATLIPDDTFDNRLGDPGETDGCETTISYDPLYKVRERRDGDWRTVIQAPEENFVQRVRLEICKNPKQTCFSIAEDLGFETFCKQKYNVWELLVSDGKGGTEKIKTELPVCCSCHYRL